MFLVPLLLLLIIRYRVDATILYAVEWHIGLI